MRKWSLVIALLGISFVCTSQITLDANTIIEEINSGNVVNYDGVTFKGDLDFTNVSTRKLEKKVNVSIVSVPLTFQNCIFEGNIITYKRNEAKKEMSNTYFNENLKFKNCNFIKSSFKYAKFYKELSYDLCYFKDTAEFKYSKFLGRVEISNCKFDNLFNAKYSKFEKQTVLKSCTFKAGVSCKYTQWNNHLLINHCVFNIKSDFKYAGFNSDAELTDNKFYSEANFKWANFKNKAIIENNLFISTTDFKYAEFGDLYLKGTVFKKENRFNAIISKDLEKYLAKSSPNKVIETITNGTPISENTYVSSTIKPAAPAILSIENIKFYDENNNNQVDGIEKCKIEFTIANKGKGTANQIAISINDNALINGLLYDKSISINSIPPASSQTVVVNVNGSIDLTSGISDLRFSFQEQNGFPPEPFNIKVNTQEHLKPNLLVVDNSFSSEGGVIRLGIPIKLKALIQNIGEGEANNVAVSFQYPTTNVYPVGDAMFNIGTMQSGESREVEFEFFTNKLYDSNHIPIQIVISEEYKRFGKNKLLTANLNTETNVTNKDITLKSKANNETQLQVQIASLSSDVDKGIPINNIQQNNMYALIIGNEDYQSRQTGLSVEQNVEYAINDAEVFAKYCQNTLGVPSKQIKLLRNATSVEIKQALSWINNLSKLESGNAKLMFYYSGHGLPHETTKEPYLIPVDVSGTNIEYGVKLNDVYSKLTEFPAKQITIILDACFSGGARNQGLVAMKGVRVKPKENMVNGNVVVFSSSSGEESSAIYKEKQHGYFTYFLLKKLKETNGDVGFEELANYIIQNVSKEAALNSKIQTPQVNTSYEIREEWKKWKLK